MPTAFDGSQRKNLVPSMIIVAGLLGGAVLATSAITNYFRSQDPVNQCINDPESQPFQLAVPVSVIEDGIPALVPKGVGIKDGCIRPVHMTQRYSSMISLRLRAIFVIFC
jgi:hypothetical protein